MKLLLLLAAVCGALAVPVRDETEEAVLDEFLAGNRLFTANVYKELLADTTGDMIFSPFSVESILSLTYEGSKGETASELVAGLSLPDTDEKVQQAYTALMPKLRRSGDENLVFSSANKIYIDDGLELDETFAAVASTVYGSEVESVNFSANFAVANKINKYVAEKTNDKIQGLVDPFSIGEFTQILLVNALYFSGQWQVPFVNFPTSKANFSRTEDDIVTLSMMHNEEYYNYYENTDLDAKFLELPIKGDNVSMIVVLPNTLSGLPTLEENIDRVLQPQPFTKEGVNLDLPIISISTTAQMVPILQDLGIQKIFDVSAADLSGITSTNQEFYISNVVHKAYIRVDEDGLEAAAATDVVGPTSEVELTEEFTADHPFLFYIVDQGVITFIGRYARPLDYC